MEADSSEIVLKPGTSLSLNVDKVIEHQGGVVYEFEETKKGRIITPRTKYKMIRTATTDMIENMVDTPENE